MKNTIIKIVFAMGILVLANSCKKEDAEIIVT